MFLKPDYNLKNIYEIDFTELKNKGIKCIMFDLDSTVMVSKSADFLPETVEWFNSFLRDINTKLTENNGCYQFHHLKLKVVFFMAVNFLLDISSASN